MNFADIKSLTIGGQAVKSLSIGGQVVWVKGVELYDYLEGDGTAYIDTNYTITDYYQINTKFKYNSRGTFNTLYGVMKSASAVMPRMGFHSYQSKWMYGINTTTSTISSDNDIHTLQDNYSNSRETVVLDSTSWSNSVSNPLSSNDLSLFVLARNQAEGATNISSARIYYFKLYDSSGTLVRDFRPCTYNGEAGLWDMVNGVFYGNANSSGAFTVGNE